MDKYINKQKAFSNPSRMMKVNKKPEEKKIVNMARKSSLPCQIKLFIHNKDWASLSFQPLTNPPLISWHEV